MELEVLIHGAIPEAQVLSMRVTNKPSRRRGIAGSTATQFLPLLKKSYRHAVPCQVIADYQTLLTSPDHHSIETPIGH
jgi:hypothetical protein